MIKVALKGLAGRKVRALLTAFAVIIGVSMVSGTFVLTDTMQKSFDGIFETSYENTDVIVSGHQVVESDTADVPTIPSSLLRDVRALDEVGAAAGSIQDDTSATIIGRDGDSLAGQNPTIVSAFDYTQPQLSPLKLQSGEWAQGDSEIAIDAGTAKKHDYAIGDTVGVSANGPVEQYTITGIAKYGEVDSIGGAVIAVFDMPTAQTLLHQEGRYDELAVTAADGTSESQLRDAVGAARARRRRRQARLPGGQGCRQGDQRGPRLRADLPARLRRHRAVRGRVRDLQHPVDHGRPAHARVRDAAHARRLAQAGAALGPARGPRHRPAGLAGRARARHRHRQGHERAVRGVRHRPAQRRHRRRHAHDRRLAADRHGHHAALEHRARPPGDARAADRGCARGLRAAADEHAEALDEGGARHHRRRRGRDVDRRVRQRLRRARRAAARRRRADAVHRRGPDRAAAREADRERGRLAGAPPRRLRGAAGELELGPQPVAHGGHRRRADGRPHAGHGGRRARQRPADVGERRGRQAAPRRRLRPRRLGRRHVRRRGRRGAGRHGGRGATSRASATARR